TPVTRASASSLREKTVVANAGVGNVAPPVVVAKPKRRPPDLPVKPLTEDESSLLKACEMGDLDAVYATLWAERPDINCRKIGFGSTPLAVACRTGNRQVAGVLLSFGADVSALDEYGVSPLHWAATSGSTDLVLQLLQAAQRKGILKPVLACLNAPTTGVAAVNLLATKDAFGSTALHFASVLNLPDVVRVLIQAGCDPTAKNNDGRTASDLATDDRLKTFLQESEQRLKTHITAYARLRRKQEAAAAAGAEATGGSTRRGGSAGKKAAVAVKARSRPGTAPTSKRRA
ncbi:hypothetical protein HKX48_001475, partial [Thoreauomyces humboldtii]